MKKSILLLACLIGMASCSKTENLFDTERVKEEAKENFPTQDIDPGHDWNMAAVKSLTVTVNKTAGESYIIWIYKGDPFKEDNNAKLLKEGIEVKNGISTSVSFDVASDLEYVYVVCEDKNHGYTMKPVAFANNKAEVFFGTQNTSPRSVRSSFMTVGSSRALPATEEEIEAIKRLGEYSGWVSNASYKITKDCTINCGDNTILYVLGNVTINYTWMGSGSHLIILPGAKATISNLLNVNGGNVSVCEGGTLIANSGIEIESDKKFYNMGTVNVSSDIKMNGGTFINDVDGNVVVAGETYLNSKSCYWENNGYYHTGSVDIHANGAEVFNKCKLEIDGLLKMNTSGAKITIDGGASIKCGSLLMNNATIIMGGDALVDVTGNAEFTYNNRIEAVSTDNAVLRMAHAISTKANQGNTINYFGDLGIDCQDHFAYGLSGSVPFYTLNDGADFIKGSSSEYIIPNSKCTPGYNPSPSLLPNNSQIYTYAFEDITTKGGDYDFNDIVLKVKTVPVDDGKLEVTLVAAGATKDLEVYYNNQLLFGGEVHIAMGCQPGEMINTGGGVVGKEVVDRSIVWQDGYTLKKNGNFSIRDVKEDMWVKLPAFDETFKAGDVPYAILVPDDWDFPAERHRVDQKYPNFVEWAKDATKDSDWYLIKN